MVAGVGVIPSTEYLKDSGLSINKYGFINVDKNLRVVKEGSDDEVFENIYAAGDVAMYPQM